MSDIVIFDEYASLVDRTVCFLNSAATPELVFTQQGDNRELKQPAILRMLETWWQA